MNVKPLLISVCLLPVATSVFAGIPTVDNTETVIYKANAYSIYDASLWSADGPRQLSVDWAISEQQWDSVFGRPPSARLGVGQVIEECFLGICAKAGAAAGLEATAYVLPYLKADLNPGTFDATVAYQPSVEYQFEGLGVDFFKLNTSDGFDASSSQFIVHAPSIKLETGLNISADLNLFAEACLLGCFVDETYNLASADFKLPLLQIDTLASEAKVFSPPTDVLQLIELFGELVTNPPDSFDEIADTVLYDDISAVIGRVSEAQWDKYKADLKKQSDQGDTSATDKLDKIEKAESLIAASPLTVEFSNPYTSDAEGEWGGTDANPQAINVATATIGGDLLDLRLDVDKVLGYAFGLPNGGTISLEDVGIKDSPLDVELTLFDIQAGPSINLETELTLAPELMVTLDFSAPVLIKGEIGAQTSYTGLWSDIPQIALLASQTTKNDQLVVGQNDGRFQEYKTDQLYQYSEIVTATPTFSVAANLSNRTYIDVAVAAEIQGLGASVGIDGFAELEIGPVFNFAAESASLAQIDVYNETFAVSGWAVEGNRNTGSTTIANNSNPTVTSNNVLAEQLSFNSAGEIMFQARSVGDASYDIAYTSGQLDNRIKQYVTVQSLVNNEVDRRMYEFTPFENTEIITEQLFEFNDVNVAKSVYREYKIDSGQRAQVMTDGQLVVQNSFTDLIIEVGGSLELAAEHPYAGNSGSSTNGVAYGLVNSGIMKVYGDVYMGADNLNANDADRYKFTNNGQTIIGSDGSVKFDGKFENTSRGVVDNFGRFELTGTNNQSANIINNRYDAEFDLFGKLNLIAAPATNKELRNDGTLTLYKGAELIADGSASQGRATEIVNNGSFVLAKDSEVALGAAGNAAANVSLSNTHVIDNSGTILNRTGSTLVNGVQGSNWSLLRNQADLVATVNSQRESQIGSLDAAYALANNNVRSDVFKAAGSKQAFLSTMNSYMTMAQPRLEPKLGAAAEFEGYKNAYDDAKVAKIEAENNYNNYLIEFNKLEPFLKSIFQPTLDGLKERFDRSVSSLNSRKAAFERELGFKMNAYQDSNVFKRAYYVRTAESTYGDSLRSLDASRQVATSIYQQIDAELALQTESGIGIIVNRKDGLLINTGDIINHAVMLNEAKGEIYNDLGGHINNAGGYLRNNGLLVNQEGAQFTNTGVIDNGMQSVRDTFGILDIAQMVNLGELNNQGELVNNDTLVNYGVLQNTGPSNNPSTALLINNGTLSNLGQITNDAMITNDSGAELNNHASMVNNGTLTNDGIFNNGQVGKGTKLSVTNVIADALSFYRQKQTLRSLDNASSKLEEQIKDSRAREGLVQLQQIPLVSTNNFLYNFIQNSAIKIANSYLRTAYNLSLAAAKANTTIYETAYATNSQGITNANATMIGLDSVATKSYTDANGNIVTGSPYINLAAIGSVNTAKLENNGTIVNRGLLNNVGTITNNADGQIRNSGILMIGKEGLIDNAGTLALESAILTSVDANGNATSFEQTGMLISNGTINNSNLIDISAGTLVNGTLAERSAVINNSGDIRLSASADLVLNAETGKETLVYSTASLINQASINNQSGGLIQIGQNNPLIQANGLESINMLVNFGQINNQDDASIENNGMLYNAGSIDNQAGSSFTSTGVINNAATGDISFAEAATVGGDVINNGFINMADGEILTLTGGISGNGTFAGSTMLNGASVNPGNSPGLLTFAGDVVAQNVDWIMEIWGTERGVGYDAVDILGDFTIVGDMSFSILSLLDFDTIIAQDFNFLSISGQLFGELGQMITESFSFVGFNDEMANNWSGNWIKNLLGGWSLNLSFIGNNVDLYADLPTLRVLDRFQNTPTDVPEPGPLSLLLIGLSVLWWRSVAAKKQSVSTAGLQ